MEEIIGGDVVTFLFAFVTFPFFPFSVLLPVNYIIFPYLGGGGALGVSLNGRALCLGFTKLKTRANPLIRS
jgi:hypothetical protein